MVIRGRHDVEALALLSEPARRSLYDWVAGQGRAVSRDEAAAGTGLSRPLTAFHLDRLARAGLLEVEYRRLSGRSGPGAGRPAKLYRRSGHDVAVSVPPRDYEAAARLLAEAIEQSAPVGPAEELREAARRVGREAAAGRRNDPASVSAGQPEALVALLEERGYEPVLQGGEIRLRNCPFHALVENHRQLVCGMNHALAQGLLDGLGAVGVSARLAPEPGYCCVKFEADGETSGD